MLLSEAIERLAIATRANSRTQRTVQSYREKLGHLVRFLGDVEVESITTDDLRRYIVYMKDERQLSKFTVHTRAAAVRRLFNWLEQEGRMPHNPFDRIKLKTPKRTEPKSIEWDDFLALLKTTEGNSVLDIRDRAVLMFLADTGCRVGGLLGLKVDDLDLERRRAVVTEKCDKTRLVFFRETTARALAAWLEVRPQDKGAWLFVSFKGKCEELTISGVRHLLEGRGERAGCEGPVNAHAFRHGFARHFLLSGGDLGTLADLMGHSTVAVTKDYYGIFTADELAAKHERHSPIAQLEAVSSHQ
jgi:integrase/recombinase XerD